MTRSEDSEGDGVSCRGARSGDPADRISLLGVSARGTHGVLDSERRDGQQFVVDVVMHLDLTRPGRSDALGDTVSYAEVASDVVARITGEPVQLIERLAELIAADVLDRPRVEAVEVTVHKPRAPVEHSFTDVHVRIHRQRGAPVVIALGGNLRDVQSTLEAAVRDIAAIPSVRVAAVSPLVESDPVGGPDQPAFLNAVLLAHTTLSPDALLHRLQEIEERHGRTREIPWGPRTLDLDLIQYGGRQPGAPGRPGEVVSADPELSLPHPRAAERPFVLRPWLQVDPDAQLAGRSVAELLRSLDQSGLRPGPQWRPAW